MPIIYILSVSAFLLQWPNWVDVTESVCPGKPMHSFSSLHTSGFPWNKQLSSFFVLVFFLLLSFLCLCHHSIPNSQLVVHICSPPSFLSGVSPPVSSWRCLSRSLQPCSRLDHCSLTPCLSLSWGLPSPRFCAGTPVSWCHDFLFLGVLSCFGGAFLAQWSSILGCALEWPREL